MHCFLPAVKGEGGTMVLNAKVSLISLSNTRLISTWLCQSLVCQAQGPVGWGYVFLWSALLTTTVRVSYVSATFAKKASSQLREQSLVLSPRLWTLPTIDGTDSCNLKPWTFKPTPFFQVQRPSPDRDDPWRSIFHIVLRTLFFLFRLTPLMGLINIYLRPASLFSSHQRARVTPTECGRSTRNWAPLSFDTFQFVGTCEGFGVNF